MSAMLLEIQDVKKSFPASGGFLGRGAGRVQAVRGVSLSLAPGETVGLVGESGCGKSTLGQLALRLIDPDEGSIRFEGREITHLTRRELKPFRRQMQIIFQDPFASLNPRMTVADIVAEPLVVYRAGGARARRERVEELLALVGLGPDVADRYPHEFSGGQRQRIGIARAVALEPKLVIADEPVSALDVSIRGEILNLLMDLRERLGIGFLFIAHDLNVVEHVSDRIAVMYLGKLMEMFPAQSLGQARHPYTRALILAIPVPDPEVPRKSAPLVGDVPSPLSPPAGCSFHPRCPFAQEVCTEREPPFAERRPGLFAACHRIEEMEGLAP